MKLEVGKYYVSRGGDRVGPMQNQDGILGYPWDAKGDSSTRFFYTDSGVADDGEEFDLVSEWLDANGATGHGSKEPTKRAQILDKAKEYVTKDRNATHGEPEDTFGAIAGLWSAYLGSEVSQADVCNLMVLLKVARAKANPLNDDNFEDMAGYAACGAEVAK